MDKYDIDKEKISLEEYLSKKENYSGVQKLEDGTIKGIYKGYEFEIDTNNNVTISEKTEFTLDYSLNQSGYTKDSIEITLKYSLLRGTTLQSITLTKASISDGIKANASDITKYTVTKNGTYTFLAKDSAGNERSKDIIIKNIDTILPIINSAEVTNVTSTSFVIKIDAVDADASDISAKSGIKKYEYIIDGNVKASSDTNEIKVENLEANTLYNGYVKAIDNAGNESATYPVNVKTFSKNIENLDDLLEYVGTEKDYSNEDIINNKDGVLDKILSNNDAVEYIFNNSDKYMDVLTSSKEAMSALGQNSEAIKKIIDSDEWCKQIADSEHKGDFSEYFLYYENSLVGEAGNRKYYKLKRGFTLAACYRSNGPMFILISKNSDCVLGYCTYKPSDTNTQASEKGSFEFEGDIWYYSCIPYGWSTVDATLQMTNCKNIDRMPSPEAAARYVLNDLF